MTAPPPRSWLFVPADSEKKIAKALASEADAVILDLEDSVAAGRKKDAREIAVAALIQSGSGPQRWVRINPLDSGLVEDDLAAIGALPIAGVVLPKAERGADIARLAAMLGGDMRIHAVATETAASLFGLGTYADAPRLAAMSWGAEDLSAALGAASKYDADGGLSFTYRMARSLCLAGAVAAGVQPVDGVFADFRDAGGLCAESAAARREGFTGKLAIHPDQVGPINAAFTPSCAEVAAAEQIVALFAANPDAGTLALDGRMLDRPHLLQAEQVLARRR
jgi:citrate lyase subunit beta/citryl-CoA lyase